MKTSDTARYRGFESHLLRQTKPPKAVFCLAEKVGIKRNHRFVGAGELRIRSTCGARARTMCRQRRGRSADWRAQSIPPSYIRNFRQNSCREGGFLFGGEGGHKEKPPVRRSRRTENQIDLRSSSTNNVPPAPGALGRLESAEYPTFIHSKFPPKQLQGRRFYNFHSRGIHGLFYIIQNLYSTFLFFGYGKLGKETS